MGLLAWIVEKYKEWSGCTHTPDEAIDVDSLLTNVTLYWLTNSATSSAQFYFENSHTDEMYLRTWSGPFNNPQPVGVSTYRHDPAQAIHSLAVRNFPSLVQWRRHDVGGHFAPAEQPDLFVQDLREFVQRLRHDQGPLSSDTAIM